MCLVPVCRVYVGSRLVICCGDSKTLVLGLCSMNKDKSSLFLTQANSHGFVFLQTFLELIPVVEGI